jgi:hypothetical protein
LRTEIEKDKKPELKVEGGCKQQRYHRDVLDRFFNGKQTVKAVDHRDLALPAAGRLRFITEIGAVPVGKGEGRIAFVDIIDGKGVPVPIGSKEEGIQAGERIFPQRMQPEVEKRSPILVIDGILEAQLDAVGEAGGVLLQIFLGKIPVQDLFFLRRKMGRGILIHPCQLHDRHGQDLLMFAALRMQSLDEEPVCAGTKHERKTEEKGKDRRGGRLTGVKKTSVSEEQEEADQHKEQISVERIFAVEKKEGCGSHKQEGFLFAAKRRGEEEEVCNPCQKKQEKGVEKPVLAGAEHKHHDRGEEAEVEEREETKAPLDPAFLQP